MVGPTALVALVLFAALLAGAGPAGAHGSGPPARPVVTGVEPAKANVTASVVFIEAWRIQLASTTTETVAVVDHKGRPFLRITPAGVEADFGAREWFESNIITAGQVVNEDLHEGAPEDWRKVSSEPVWSWLDRRIRPEPGLLTREVLKQSKPVPLRDFEVPIRIGDRPGTINGRLEFEPPVGRYRHTILSATEPVPGLLVGRLQGPVAPSLTLENRTGQTVTVVGAAGEPMVRMHGSAIEANLLSPGWVPIGQTMGSTPSIAPDPAAAPRWQLTFEGSRWSWPDYRSRPPDADLPPLSLSKGGTVTVKRWEIPIDVGSKRIVVRGITEVVPLDAAAGPPGKGAGWRWATLAVLVVGGGAFVLLRDRDQPIGALQR